MRQGEVRRWSKGRVRGGRKRELRASEVETHRRSPPAAASRIRRQIRVWEGRKRKRKVNNPQLTIGRHVLLKTLRRRKTKKTNDNNENNNKN